MKHLFRTFYFALLALLVYSKTGHPINAKEQQSNSDYSKKGYLTFANKPLGSPNRPLVLRTFVPTAGVSKQEVLANHSKGTNSPKYGASIGRNPKMFFPIDGIPAAIAVNLGKTLSYVWDTTECRDCYMHGLTDSLI